MPALELLSSQIFLSRILSISMMLLQYFECHQCQLRVRFGLLIGSFTIHLYTKKYDVYECSRLHLFQ